MPIRVRPVREQDGTRAWVLSEDGSPHRPLAVLTDEDMRRAVEDYTAQAGLPAARTTPRGRGGRRRLWPAVLALLFLAAVALACLVWWQGREPLKGRFLRVHVGMTAAEAREVMGSWDCEERTFDESVPGSGSEELLELRWDDGGNYYLVTCGYQDRKVRYLRELPHDPAEGLLSRLLRSAGLSK